MDVWHRFAFRSDPAREAALQALGVGYEKRPEVHGAPGTVVVIVMESNPLWVQIEAANRNQPGTHFWDSEFSIKEILGSEWVRIIPSFERGYPLPDDTWMAVTYEEACPTCRAGFRQKAPFRITGEPHMGKHDVVSLYSSGPLVHHRKG